MSFPGWLFRGENTNMNFSFANWFHAYARRALYCVAVAVVCVFLARTIGANQNLLDVDRIEILKGPQGTLFGANTIGGAINIVTHTPGSTPHFVAEAVTGRFNRRDFAFTADMPISGTLLSSITVSSQVRDGYQRVIPYPPG